MKISLTNALEVAAKMHEEVISENMVYRISKEKIAKAFKVNNNFSKTGEIDTENAKIVSKMTNLEGLISDIEKEINEIKKNELLRIEKEFLTNDYEKRFNAGHLVLLSAIIGKDNSTNEYAKQMRNRQVFK